MTIDKDALQGMKLQELRDIVRLAEEEVRDRRCHSVLTDAHAPCTAEPPHADGWHEYRESHSWRTASPAHTSQPHPVVIRWRFDDAVVERERTFEAQRSPGAN